MWIYMKESKVNRIKFYTKPTATFHPIQLVNPESFKLEKFNWRYDQRPKSKEDLLKDPEPEPEPIKLDADGDNTKKGSKLNAGKPMTPEPPKGPEEVPVEDEVLEDKP
jgi:hypothetical protein